MPVIMFWNIKKGSATSYLHDVLTENEVDIAILAETDELDPPSRHLNVVPSPQPFVEYAPVPSRIKFFTRLPISTLNLASDDARMSARIFTPIIGRPILIFGVHLPSRIHSDTDDQYYYAQRLRVFIEEAELRSNIFDSVVIGDFNMNPFDKGMTAADALHGMLDKNVAKKFQRTFSSDVFKFFYNPFWSKIGDENMGPPGTYYYNNSGIINLYWNTFDQALIRPSLIDCYKSSEIITQIGGVPLVEKYLINQSISDHLPIIIHLEIERALS